MKNGWNVVLCFLNVNKSTNEGFFFPFVCFVLIDKLGERRVLFILKMGHLPTIILLKFE